MHPVKPAPAPQSEVRRVPSSFAPATVQFGELCNAIKLFAPLLTYSMMSISPFNGHNPLPNIHKAGQTPQVFDGI